MCKGVRVSYYICFYTYANVYVFECYIYKFYGIKRINEIKLALAYSLTFTIDVLIVKETIVKSELMIQMSIHNLKQFFLTC